jgi:hypothetical protein
MIAQAGARWEDEFLAIPHYFVQPFGTRSERTGVGSVGNPSGVNQLVAHDEPCCAARVSRT